ncbi:sulfotransferase 1A1-like [Diadema setosum]|uniref:sulfotransferase 1A1-like n=1 Tax=Diadema setosum TaxID=31175 RepID=UPI003B3ADE82
MRGMEDRGNHFGAKEMKAKTSSPVFLAPVLLRYNARLKARVSHAPRNMNISHLSSDHCTGYNFTTASSSKFYSSHTRLSTTTTIDNLAPSYLHHLVSLDPDYIFFSNKQTSSFSLHCTLSTYIGTAHPYSLRRPRLQQGSPAAAGTSLMDQLPECAKNLCYEKDGYILSFFMTPNCIEKTKAFKTRPDDVFIVTYPKTGTTWAQLVAYLVKVDGDEKMLEGRHIMEEVKFLETPDLESEEELPSAEEEMNEATAGSRAFRLLQQLQNARTTCDVADAMPRDSSRILKTHVMPVWLPENLRDDPKVKVIYMARNPKDTAVSFYHFCMYIRGLPKYESFDQFMEEFLAGRLPVGDYFDHTLYWTKLRNHPNVLFLTYEDMKQDPRKAVVQIAEFMGKSLPDDVIDKIVKLSSFDAMKKSASTDMSQAAAFKQEVDDSGNKSFFRKGIVGDWKNIMSEDHRRRVGALFEKKFAGTGLVLMS